MALDNSSAACGRVQHDNILSGQGLGGSCRPEAAPVGSTRRGFTQAEGMFRDERAAARSKYGGRTRDRHVCQGGSGVVPASASSLECLAGVASA